MKKKSRAKLIKKLDKVWSEAVRKRDRVCQLCCAKPISAHHAFGRTHMATRFDLYNGVGLCFYHHLYFAHRDSAGFTEWFRRHIGNDQYNRLAEAHNIITKYSIEDLDGIYAGLTAELVCL